MGQRRRHGSRSTRRFCGAKTKRRAAETLGRKRCGCCPRCTSTLGAPRRDCGSPRSRPRPCGPTTDRTMPARRGPFPRSRWATIGGARPSGGRAVAGGGRDDGATLGPDHQDTLRNRVNLGAILLSADGVEEALGILEAVDEPLRRRYGPNHRVVVGNAVNAALGATTYGSMRGDMAWLRRGEALIRAALVDDEVAESRRDRRLGFASTRARHQPDRARSVG